MNCPTTNGCVRSFGFLLIIVVSQDSELVIFQIAVYRLWIRLYEKLPILPITTLILSESRITRRTTEDADVD